MQYNQYVAAVESAKAANNIGAILLSKTKLKQQAERMHPTFWSAYRIEEYERLLEKKPSVSKLSAKVGQAVFPSCVSAELSLLYRVVLTPNTVGYHRILAPSVKEKDYLLDILNRSVSAYRGYVDLSVVLEPEYAEVAQPWSDVPIDGRSMGLAVRVAVESYNLDELIGGPDDERYVFTGEVRENSLVEIAHLEAKAKSLQQWRHQAILISPQQQNSSMPNVTGCPNMNAVYTEMQGAAQSWQKLYHQVRNRTRDHSRVVQIILPWFDGLQDLSLNTVDEKFMTRFKLRIMLKVIPAYNHLGRATEALPLVNALTKFLNAQKPREVHKLLQEGNENWHMLFANCAVSFLDDFEIEQGLQLYELPIRDAFDEQPLIHYQGAKASLLMAKGCFEEAKALYEENIELSRENEGDPAGTELVRTLCYYGNLLRVMGLYTEAEAVFKEGIEKTGNPMYDGHNTLDWIQWQYAKLLHDVGRADEIAAFEKPLSAFAFGFAAINCAYPKTEAALEKGLQYFAKNQNPMSKLYQSAKLRGEAQLQVHQTGTVEPATLAKLQALHPDWSALTYPELLQRIPY